MEFPVRYVSHNITFTSPGHLCITISVFYSHPKSGWWCNVPILKNDGVRQWGWDDIPYMKWKKKFQTTNQKRNRTRMIKE
jgi:hypothetical protein